MPYLTGALNLSRAGLILAPRKTGWQPCTLILPRVPSLLGRARNANLKNRSVGMAWFRKKPTSGLIHHSERGSQYASHVFQARLKEYGMVCSMSRKCNCWDNASSESFFNSLENKRAHGPATARGPKRMADLFDYIEPFYNRKRLHCRNKLLHHNGHQSLPSGVVCL